MKNNIKYLAILALGLVACEPEFDNPIDEGETFSSGEADFSNFVAVGNSLTAGFADNSLYITGQENSYPNIMAEQFALVGGGEFIQPLMADNTGGSLFNGTQIFNNRLVLAFDAEGNPGPTIFTGAAPTTEVSNILAGPFNNVGVPGAKSFQLGFSGFGNVANISLGLANPYYVRFASSPDATVIGDAVAQNPSFFSLWIGNNDILSYATSGGVGLDHNITGEMNPANYGPNDITNNLTFAGVYSDLVAALTSNGADGVLISIADVTSIPFFTTVPFAPLNPLDPGFGPQIPTLNATFAGLNQAFAFLGVPERSIEFSMTGASPVVIRDESLTDISAQLAPVLTPSLGAGQAAIFAAQFGQARQATADDLLVLTSSSLIGEVNETRLAELMSFGLTEEQAGDLAVNGVTFPMEDQFVLTTSEIQAIATAQASYNTTIRGLAEANGLAFYDAATDLAQLATGGIEFDGGVVTSDFVTGGAFSLDGVHPTPRGYAITANGILEAIEDTYGAVLPEVNPGDYDTVTLSNEVN